MDVRISLIVARARNGVIGADGALPWRLKDDLAFFRRTTLGAPIIMGRKTWESLPRRPLPGRPNIVLTRDPAYRAAGAMTYPNLPACLSAARAMAARLGRDEAFVIGGSQVYEASLDHADRIYLTRIEADIDGDAVFPAIDMACWQQSRLGHFEAGPDNTHPFTIDCLDRI